MSGTTQWPQAVLTEADLAVIARTRWVVHPAPTVIAVASAWQAGMNTADMAADLGCRPGSLRCLIGKLTQIGVNLRPARDIAGRPVGPSSPPKRSALAHQVGEEQIARLRKLAPYEPAAARALALMGGAQ